MFDIHDKFCLAVSTPENQPLGVGLLAGLLVRGLLAVGTDVPSVPYDKFTTTHVRLQSFCPLFQEMKENILTPETEKNRKAYSFCFLRRLLARGRLRPDPLGSIYLIQAYSP